MTTEFSTKPYMLFVAVCIALILFTLDLLLPQEFDPGCLYVVVVTLALWSPNRAHVLVAGVIVSVFSLGDLLLPSHHITPMAMLNEASRLLGIGIVTFISYQFKKQQTLKDGEAAQVEALFTHATEGIIITDSKGTITLANPCVLTLFGYTEPEIIGAPIELLVPANVRGAHSGHRNSFLKSPSNRPMGLGLELFAERKDGTHFPVEISLSKYYAAGQLYVVAFIIDITERKKSQDLLKQINMELEKMVEDRTASLQKALAELEQSQEELSRALAKERELNEMKSRFVTTASHEFRTPLSTILSSVSLIGKYRDNTEQEKRDKHIHRIKSAINDLTDILNDFLSIGRLEEGKISANRIRFNVSRFVEGLINEVKVLSRPGQQLTSHCGGLPVITTDRSIIKHILYNLLSNAIKYSHDDSRIDLTVGTDDKLLVLKVSDNGIGIPPEDMPHMFERFFRGRNSMNIQGTGLGLNIVGKYVELLNGTINFESKLNVGTTFTVTIPLENYAEEDTADRR